MMLDVVLLAVKRVTQRIARFLEDDAEIVVPECCQVVVDPMANSRAGEIFPKKMW